MSTGTNNDDFQWQSHCRGLVQLPFVAKSSIRHPQDISTDGDIFVAAPFIAQ